MKRLAIAATILWAAQLWGAETSSREPFARGGGIGYVPRVTALPREPFALEGRSGDFEWVADLPAEERSEFDNTQAHSGTWSLRGVIPNVERGTPYGGSPRRTTSGGVLSGIVVAETFETAEWQFSAWVKLEGEADLRILCSGDGRNAIKVIESPTDGWEQVTLHLRANPRNDANFW